jgi:hypothetical protein
MIDETFEARARRLWPHFVHSFALADHLGDAADDVRQFAKLLGLPMPNSYAELTADEDAAPDDSWTGWAQAQVGSEHIGIWSPSVK